MTLETLWTSIIIPSLPNNGKGEPAKDFRKLVVPRRVWKLCGSSCISTASLPPPLTYARSPTMITKRKKQKKNENVIPQFKSDSRSNQRKNHVPYKLNPRRALLAPCHVCTGICPIPLESHWHLPEVLWYEGLLLLKGGGYGWWQGVMRWRR